MHPFHGTQGHSRISAQRTNTAVTNATFTGSATAYNNATPKQLVASTPFESTRVILRCGTNIAVAATRTDTVVELMIGASGSEVPIIGPVLIGYRNNPMIIDLPIQIPAGSRLSVRTSSARTSLATIWTMDLLGAPGRDDVPLPTRWVAYGLVDDTSANARGTLVVPGATNAWGSWTSLTTSTTYAHDLWVPMVDGGTLTVNSGRGYRLQVSIDSTTNAATEVTNGTVFEGPITNVSTSEVMTDGYLTVGMCLGGPGNPIQYAPRQSGASVSVRAMCSGTVDTNCLGAAVLAAI